MAAITTAPQVARDDVAAPGWAWFVLALAAGVLWIVAFENAQLLDIVGAEAAASGNFFHELFHDGRHLLGVPCH